VEPVGQGASTVSHTGSAAGPDLDGRTITSTSSASLDGILPGRTHLPGTAGYDAARGGFDLSAIPAPDVAVSATDEADVAAAVRFAAGRGLPVAVRATGHGPVPGVNQGLLIDTRALSSVTVDPERRRLLTGVTTADGAGPTPGVDRRGTGRGREGSRPSARP
jgi:hypothetical protein